MSEKKPTPCPKCDAMRARENRLHDVGLPCDICGGRGFDYLGRPCRHCTRIDGEDGG